MAVHLDEKKKDQYSYESSGFFVLRTPLFSFQEFLNWSDSPSFPKKDDGKPIENEILKKIEHLKESLRLITRKEGLLEALYIASPGLLSRLNSLAESSISKKSLGIERAFIRYFSRACGRATPFGLFAGYSVGYIGERTKLQLAKRSEYKKITRLDTQYLTTLVDTLSLKQNVRESIRYFVNDSLYPAATHYHYAEIENETTHRSHKLVAIDGSIVLDAILEKAKTGVLISDLVNLIHSVRPETEPDEAREYINELIDNQILVPELAVPLTESNAIEYVLEHLKRYSSTTELSGPLERVSHFLKKMDHEGLNTQTESYTEVANLLKGYGAKIDPAKLFQVDLIKPSQLTVSHKVVTEIRKAVALLHKIARPRKNPLTEFQKAFINRYEGKEVPLVEVLDDEVGIGFDTSHVNHFQDEDIVGDTAYVTKHEMPLVWSGVDSFLLGKLTDSIKNNRLEILLEEKDISILENKKRIPLPDAFCAFGEILASSSESIDKGDFLVRLETASGPSGANLLGRFCPADVELTKLVREHLKQEEILNPDAIYAEIVHLPDGRMGNVLSRPALRNYEITYLGVSGLSKERQIPITDILISYSEGQLRLRSKKLGREVIPRLTTAHNYRHAGNVKLYRFLCAMQEQGVQSVSYWNWGYLSVSRFLPRVRFGRIILSRAMWNLNEEEIKELAKKDPVARYSLLKNWQEERMIPRFVALVEADNELPIDLDNPLSADTFCDLVKTKTRATLVEMIAPNESLICVTGPEGSYISQFVIPFVKVRKENQALNVTNVIRRANSNDEITRNLTPFSECFYLKLYCGPATADRILTETLQPIIDDAVRARIINKWFFIRYADPDWHLRIRFFGDPDLIWKQLKPLIDRRLDSLIKSGQVWKVQIDTYVREIERYGGAVGLRLAEDFFHIDSEVLLEAIPELMGDDKSNARWLFALWSVDKLLSDIGFNLEQKNRLFNYWSESQSRTVGNYAVYRKKISERYRTERVFVENVLFSDGKKDFSESLINSIKRRSNSFTLIADELYQAQANGELSVAVEKLVPVYIHMHLNRLFRKDHRAQEIALFEFLPRFYQSAVARTADPQSEINPNQKEGAVYV